MLKLKSLLPMLFLGLLVVGFSSCDEDDDLDDTTDDSIAEIVAGQDQFSILQAALEQVDLDDVLSGTGPFTVFAPTNDAFQAAGITSLDGFTNEELTEVLLYHVIGGAGIASTDLAEGQTYAATAANTGPNGTQLSILIERTGGNVTVNNVANVETANVRAENGIIHIIDQAIVPLDVVGHAQANSNFTSLVGALGAANGGLVSVLQSDGPFTVFAPLNSAFTAIQSTVDGLDADQLASVLLYHVVSGANVRSTMLSAGPVTTANAGTTVEVSLDPVQITDSNGNAVDVVLTDVQGTNGVIHVIDQVLIPDNLD